MKLVLEPYQQRTLHLKSMKLFHSFEGHNVSMTNFQFSSYCNRIYLLYFQLPSTEFFNGRPEKIVVEYWKRYSEGYLNKTEFINVTVNNGSAESIVLKGLDLYVNYSVVVRLCTGGGCSNRSQVFTILAEIAEGTGTMFLSLQNTLV